LLECPSCQLASGRRQCRPAHRSLEFQQLAPQRIRLRGVSLVEFAKLLPNLALLPEEDETKKDDEYELH
jgi:hypothetical protein